MERTQWALGTEGHRVAHIVQLCWAYAGSNVMLPKVQIPPTPAPRPSHTDLIYGQDSSIRNDFTAS